MNKPILRSIRKLSLHTSEMMKAIGNLWKHNDREVSQKCWDEWISKKAVANAGVVIVNPEKQVLLLKRKKGSTKDKWEIPSGGINRCEEPQAAAIRELEEETKIPLGTNQLKEIGTFTASHEDKTDIITTFLGCYPKGRDKDDITLGDEHCKPHKWLPLNEYNTTDFPMHKTTIKQIKAAYDLVSKEKKTNHD